MYFIKWCLIIFALIGWNIFLLWLLTKHYRVYSENKWSKNERGNQKIVQISMLGDERKIAVLKIVCNDWLFCFWWTACGARYKTRPGLQYHYNHFHNGMIEDETVPSPRPPVRASSRTAGWYLSMLCHVSLLAHSH